MSKRENKTNLIHIRVKPKVKKSKSIFKNKDLTHHNKTVVCKTKKALIFSRLLIV